MFFKQFIIFLSLGLSLIPNLLTANFSPLISQASTPETDEPKKRPAPPQRIPPNKVKPGGGLNPSQQACSQQNESLIALVPVDNPVLTTKDNPSFLFYVPDLAMEINHGEFALFTADEKTRLYATQVMFRPQETPGIIKIDIPPSAQLKLQQEKYYHWYFRVYCQNTSTLQESLDVDGWIKKVALTPDRKSQIKNADPDIWYDAIAEVAENLKSSPQSLSTRDRWFKILQHINLEHLANYSAIDCHCTSDLETEQQTK